jgi:hypothetical protein
MTKQAKALALCALFLFSAFEAGWSNRALAETPAQDELQQTEEQKKQIGMYKAEWTLGDFDAKNRLIFFWSPTNAESIEAFRKILAPMFASKFLKGGHKDLLIIVRQVQEKRAEDWNGPGSLLICAPNPGKYIELALDYIAHFQPSDATDFHPYTGDKGDKTPFYLNDNIDRLIREGKLDIQECQASEYYWARRIQAIGRQKAFNKKTKLKAIPSFVINGTEMLPTDPRINEFIAPYLKRTPAKPKPVI